MLQFKGLVEKEINGKTIRLKFNMATLTLLGDLQNVSLAELAQELEAPKLSTVANFMYAASVVYDRQEKPKEPQAATQDDACEWIEAIGFREALKIVNDAFESPDVKNESAPK